MRNRCYRWRKEHATAPGPHRPARPEDLDAVAAIYGDAGEMSRGREAVARMLERTWVVEDAGRIVSAAASTARTDQAAMIGAVFTPPAERRRPEAGGAGPPPPGTSSP